MSFEIISNLIPPIEHVKSWQSGGEAKLGKLVEAIKLYHSMITEDPNSFVESDEYLYCQRAINLLTWYKDKGAFQEVLEIHEIFSLNDYDDFLAGVCSKYLGACVSKEDFSEIERRWKQTEKDSFYFCDLFTLLIKADPENQELLTFSKNALWDNNFILKSDIAENVSDESVLQEIRRRLRYIAPMVKYLSPNRSENPYLEEMIELGSSYFERKGGIESPNIESSSPQDEFLIEILGHTDDRSVKLIRERIDRYEAMNAEYLNYRDQKTAYFEREFMDGLPPTSEEWLTSLSCSQKQRDEFLDAEYEQGYSDELEEIFVIKVGRNDPCPCGSGKKYKKCCL